MSSYRRGSADGNNSPPGTPPYDAAARHREREAVAAAASAAQHQASSSSLHRRSSLEDVVGDDDMLDLPRGRGSIVVPPSAGDGGGSLAGGSRRSLLGGIDEGASSAVPPSPRGSIGHGSVGVPMGGAVDGRGDGVPRANRTFSALLPKKQMSKDTIEHARRFLWDDDDAYVTGDLVSPPTSSMMHPGAVTAGAQSGGGEQQVSLLGGGGGPSLTSRNMDWGLGTDSGNGGRGGGTPSYPWASTDSAHRSSASSATSGGLMRSIGIKGRAPPSHSSSLGKHSESMMGHFPRPDEVANSSSGNGVFRSAGKVLSSAASMLPKLGWSGGRRKTAPMSDEAARSTNIAPRKSSLDMRPADQQALNSSAFASPRKERESPFDGCVSSVGMCCSSVGYFLSTHRKPILLSALSLLFAGMATAIAVKVFYGGGEGEGEGGAASVSSSAGGGLTPPSVPDEVEVTDLAERLEAMRTNVIESGLTDPSAFDDLTSIRSRALEWLAFEDGNEIEPQDEFFLQRYALAVFYYSASESAVSSANLEEKEEEEADSPPEVGRNARELEDSPDSGDGGGSWTNNDGWLTDRGYCSWKGVQCHHRHGAPVTETTFDDNYGITHLNLTASGIYGTIPPELSALTDLRVLDLSDNSLSATIPSQLGDLGEALVTLDLANNDLTGSLSSELGRLTQCTHLVLDRNILEGSLPSQLGNMASLHILSLYENYLTGRFPLIGNMKELRSLYLDDNDFEGPLPGTILGSLTDLEDLRLGINNFTGPLPTELGSLSALRKLFLEYNEFSGRIPTEMGSMEQLEDLHLYQNKLEGPIPASLGRLKDLEVLYLDHNDLTSTIPSELGQCKYLEELYVQSNSLTGSVPEGLLDLGDSLISLHLDSNSLAGPIPADIGDRLPNLERLRMNDNALTGDVPESLANMENLEEARLQENELEGAVPERVCELRDSKGGALEVLQADCGGDEPKVICACCTDCF